MASRGPNQIGDIDPEVIGLLREQSPWLADGRVPEVFAPPRERPLAALLWRRLLGERARRFQLILGPRRVGKTTVMYQTVRRLIAGGVPSDRLWWMRLDHPRLMRHDLGRLVGGVVKAAGATQERPVCVFLDEITYANEWDLWLKTFYDERYPVRIVGTSSATAAIRERYAESGVGRWEEQYLGPYSLNEYLRLVDVPVSVTAGSDLQETVRASVPGWSPPREIDKHRRRYLFTGGFPELLLALPPEGSDESALLESQRSLRTDAVQTAIYKDIPQVYGIDRPLVLERLLYILADQVCGILSPSRICTELDSITAPTLERYMAYLERAFLVFRLQNYSGSERSRQKRGRKLFFVDGAVRNAALQRGVAPLSDPAEMGLLFENLAAAHLHLLDRHNLARVHYWRDRDDEVDFVVEGPGRLAAFEIGRSSSHHRKGLKAFFARYSSKKPELYMVAPVVEPRLPDTESGRPGVLPLDLLVLACGAQAEAAMEARLGADA